MLNTLETTLITNRLLKLKDQKNNVLKLKKSHRGKSLNEINRRIATLKNWLK